MERQSTIILSFDIDLRFCLLWSVPPWDRSERRFFPPHPSVHRFPPTANEFKFCLQVAIVLAHRSCLFLTLRRYVFGLLWGVPPWDRSGSASRSPFTGGGRRRPGTAGGGRLEQASLRPVVASGGRRRPPFQKCSQRLFFNVDRAGFRPNSPRGPWGPQSTIFYEVFCCRGKSKGKTIILYVFLCHCPTNHDNLQGFAGWRHNPRKFT